MVKIASRHKAEPVLKITIGIHGMDSFQKYSLLIATKGYEAIYSSWHSYTDIALTV